MKEWRTSAYYLVNSDLLFLVLDGKTGAISFTTCPHRATLLTSMDSAQSLLRQLNQHKDLQPFQVRPTATHDPRVLVGDL